MRAERTRLLESILEDFDPSGTSETAKHGVSLTLYVPADLKARFDRLQRLSKRQFHKKLREVVKIFIETAEAKAS